MDRVDDIVEKWTSSCTRAEVVALLHEASVPCAPVLSLAEVINDSHVRTRGMLEHHNNTDRDWWTFGSPLRLSDSPSREDNVPARLGQHSDEILHKKLGLGPERIAELRANDVI